MPGLLCIFPDCSVEIDASQIACPKHYRAIPYEFKQQYKAARRRNDNNAIADALSQIREHLEECSIGPHVITNCKAPTCGGEIVFLPNKWGGKTPVNAGTVEASDTAVDMKRHTLHKNTCTDPNHFRRSRI